jgi:hypothetical protein
LARNNALRYSQKYVKDADCGPFSLELVDKNEAWAYYPLRIKNTQKAKETADKIWNTINREGFHVVEHILLREAVNPRQICCDTISGIVTIVLPHWNERFQNEQFRSFFQATISRELPAHLAPQIFWVTPEGMAKFEQKYYQWLFQQDENNSLELRYVINDLKNYFPLATIDTKNVNAIFLDESPLN